MTETPTPRRSWRPRFSLRVIFIVMTLAAVAVFAERMMKRRAAFLERVRHYTVTEIRDSWIYPFSAEPQEVFFGRIQAYRAHFRLMREKYERAARYPWLPVEPDPPVPRLYPD